MISVAWTKSLASWERSPGNWGCVGWVAILKSAAIGSNSDHGGFVISISTTVHPVLLRCNDKMVQSLHHLFLTMIIIIIVIRMIIWTVIILIKIMMMLIIIIIIMNMIRFKWFHETCRVGAGRGQGRAFSSEWCALLQAYHNYVSLPSISLPIDNSRY